ncbi:hypothetical protein RDWZM_000205 [Blomia tropicalis]|uniref:Gamma-secretase subunit Aph-1 n=1 Tax=Blomia tropicalis TaxID=40697 RepID=A0A9Q0MD80_BLOTA|nr:hypothetical protein RDWZM_000205 [Blomia tropicalis]
MTLAEFIGCTLISFGPPLAMFCIVVAKDPIRIIILISSSFFWLLSLLLSSILWAIVVPLKEHLVFGVTFSVIFQEIFRYLFYLLLRKAEFGLQKVSDVGTDGNAKVYNDRTQLAFVSGLGFGVISGAFSLINILADSAGPGTVGINGDSQYFFLCSALTSLAFILFNIFWSIILFYACDHRKKTLIAFVAITHLFATYITFLNPRQLYAVSIPLEYTLLVITCVIALKCAGFRYDRFRNLFIKNNDGDAL